LIKTAAENGYDMKILQAVEAVNNFQKTVLFSKLNNRFQGNLKGKTIALWGLSFKPNTDDMREAPSLTIIKSILEAGGKVQAFDPVAMNEAKHFLSDSITYCNDEYHVLENADALLVVTEWIDFRVPDFEKIKSLLNNPIIFDGRNIFDTTEMNDLGFEHYGIGTK
jgi:UDPglucose 6-dehydrogenase